MKRNIGLIVLTLALSVALSGCARGGNAAIQAENNIQKSSEDIPKRTVAGTVAVLDMLDYLGIEMVGIPETERNLEEKFANIPNIGKPMTPDMELLKSVNPDLYISVTSLSEDLKSSIESQNIKTLFLENDSYDAVLESMEILGGVYGKEDLATKYVQEIEKKSASIKEKAESKESPRVMLLFGSPKSIMFATEKSFVGSLLKELGATNVVNELDDFKDSYVPVSLEHVLELEPDVILRLTHASPDQARKMFNEEFEKSDVWKRLGAVKDDRVYDLDNAYFGVSGNIRVLEALERLEEMLFE